MSRKIALLLVAGVVLVVMLFAMSPGFALPEVSKGADNAKAGGVVQLPPEAKAGDVVAQQ